MLRRIFYSLVIVVLLNSCTGCGHEEESGPAPTHWSQTPQPITPSPEQSALQARSKEALAAALAFARSKYADKLNYGTAKFERYQIKPTQGMSEEDRQRLQKERNRADATMWTLTVQVAKLQKSAPQVDPTNPSPFPISHHVFLIGKNMQISEGAPLHIPSFALERPNAKTFSEQPPDPGASGEVLLPPGAPGPPTGESMQPNR